MLATRTKEFSELKTLAPARIFVLYCLGCREILFDLDQAKALVAQLKEQGIEVVEESLADTVCRPDFTQKRLDLHAPADKGAEGILVFSCGIGVQTVADLCDLPVLTGCDTLHVPGYTGLRPQDSDCQRCGECVLGTTAGICPVANCAKSLLNGPCGGAKAGHCEVSQDKPCVWLKISEKLRDLGTPDLWHRGRMWTDYRKPEK